MRFGTVAFALVAMLGFCIPASASIVAVGEILEGNSWGQAFQEYGGGVSFTTFGASSLTGATFEVGGIRNISPIPKHDFWKINDGSGSYIGAVLNTSDYHFPVVPLSQVSFELWFNDPIPTSDVSFKFVGGNSSQATDYSKVTYHVSSKTWTIEYLDPGNGEALRTLNEIGSSSPLYTPEPGTFVVWSLLGGLAIGFGCWRKLRAGRRVRVGAL